MYSLKISSFIVNLISVFSYNKFFFLMYVDVFIGVIKINKNALMFHKAGDGFPP